jgi:hypothetical protein
VSSSRTKPGPKPAIDRDLLIWEHEWYWVFCGLTQGIPARNKMVSDWVPIPALKLSGRKELDEERLAFWFAKTRTPSGWVPRRYRQLIRALPAEPEVWEAILKARTPAQIRKACRSSRFWLNPAFGRPWVTELQTHAKEVLVAKDYRYPASSRPSSTSKRILHLARAMAGLSVGIGPVRAIDLIRTMNHGGRCKCLKCYVDRHYMLKSHFGNTQA